MGVKDARRLRSRHFGRFMRLLGMVLALVLWVLAVPALFSQGHARFQTTSWGFAGLSMRTRE